MQQARRIGTVIAGAALALGTVAAAAPAASAHIGAPTNGLSGSWARTSTAGATQTIVFKDGKVSGKAGCNRYFGTFTLDGKTVDFGPLGSTLMACEQPIMDDERAFLDALDGATKAKVKGKTLTISGPAGTLVFENMKQPRK